MTVLCVRLRVHVRVRVSSDGRRCAYVYESECMCASVFVCNRIGVCCVHVTVRVHVCASASVSVWMYVRVYACMQRPVRVRRSCACVYVGMYVCVHLD